MAHVEIYAWNPKRSRLPAAVTRRFPVGRRVNNFGDLLGPVIVKAMLKRHGIDPERAERDSRLLSVGSVLHGAADGDVVWGSGINGKMGSGVYGFTQLDVRAVRGPLTRAFLLAHGIEAPAVYGDPALLLPDLVPELAGARNVRRRAVTVVPNLNDLASYPKNANLLDPRSPLRQCISEIAASRFVIGSSLHGIVVAEAFGVPARLIASEREHWFKYEDYYLGTGRTDTGVVATIEEALERGGHQPPKIDTRSLVEAFPLDLWTGE